MKIRIGNLLDLSTIDWPSHRTFMVFCSGCNFRCPFCMNTQLIPLSSGEEIDLKHVEERILENIDFIDAIGVTGGEPGLQPEPIKELYTWAKKIVIKTFLNTNGSNSKLIEDLLTKCLLDHVTIDIKAPLISNNYRKIAGVTDDIDRILLNIKQSLELCGKAKISLEARTTIVPTLIDDEKSVREIAQTARDFDTYVLQQFFPFKVLDSKLRCVNSPDRPSLEKLARFSLEEGIKKVYIRTRKYGLEVIH